MSFNLIDSVKGLFTNELVGKAANLLGENENGISKALGGVVPTVLSTLLSKSSTSDGASSVFNLAKEAAGSGLLNNIGGLLGGGGGVTSSILNMASGLFGDKLGGLGKLISTFAGIKDSSAGSLLSMAVPAVLGFLGKHASDNNLNASGLASLLGGQKDNITRAIPSGLNLGSLGLGNFGGSVKEFASDTKRAATSTVNYAEEKASSGMKWLWPLLLALAALAAIWYLWKGCGTATTADIRTDSTTVETVVDNIQDAGTTVLGKIDSLTGDFLYETGEMIDIDLPGGVKLNVGNNSTEAKLYRFLSGSTALDTVKGNWFDFTNVRFKTGSSQITDESMAQLNNMVAITKAFPNAQFKVGGYTDNTGDSASNVVLSQKRAEAVAAQLVKMGSSKTAVVGAEGYGPQWPVGDNNTAEGRAMNRRVSLRVRAK